MFRVLRLHMKKLFWVLVILIVPAFTLWGIGGILQDESRKPVGVMYGKKVSLSSYLKVRNACILNALILYGKRYNDLAQYFDFNKQTWDRMILLKEANKQGIEISNDELALQLQRLFSVDGAFSRRRYQEFIKNTGINPLTLEENIRQTMAVGRLTRTIGDTAMVSKIEVDEALERTHEKRTVDYVDLKDSTYDKTDIYVSPEEIDEYYNNNKGEFRIPEKFKAYYVFISFDSLKNNYSVTDKEARDFYDKNKNIFKDKDKDDVTPFDKVKDEIKLRLLEQKASDA
ncbi:SurA N-terminal domain-containing protein, partial [Candidatus Auribacterota bacterium]